MRNHSVRVFLCVILVSVSALAQSDRQGDSSGGSHRYVEVHGAKLYTQSFSHGAPIVFLHGGLVFFDNNYAKQRDYFAA